MPRQDLIQVRRDTAAQWDLVNPVLGDGEVGYAEDTGQIKVGDGVTAWTALAVVGGAKVVTVPEGTTGWDTQPDGTLWVEYTP